MRYLNWVLETLVALSFIFAVTSVCADSRPKKEASSKSREMTFQERYTIVKSLQLAEAVAPRERILQEAIADLFDMLKNGDIRVVDRMADNANANTFHPIYPEIPRNTPLIGWLDAPSIRLSAGIIQNAESNPRWHSNAKLNKTETQTKQADLTSTWKNRIWLGSILFHEWKHTKQHFLTSLFHHNRSEVQDWTMQPNFLLAVKNSLPASAAQKICLIEALIESADVQIDSFKNNKGKIQNENQP